MPSGLEGIFSLGGWLNAILLPGALILIRVLPIIFITPFMGGKLIPPETRIGLSIGMTILVFPFATSVGVLDLNITGLGFIMLVLKEMFIGFVIGFIANALFMAMEVGGRALDVMRGSNQAEVQVPELQLRASPVGQFNFQLLLVIFCTMNGHVYFIESVIESFRVVPVDQFPAFTRGMEDFVDQLLVHTTSLFAIAFALVFPGLFASLLVDIVFGMFNRIAPQLNAYFMALGVKAMAGLIMLFFAMGLMMDQMEFLLEESLVFLRKMVRQFG